MSLGLPQHEATEKAWESLLPVEEVRVAENRRTYAHLLARAEQGVAGTVRKKGGAA